MQNAKDTFYQMLRDRIAGGNPERTVVVRGVERTAVLVEENELPSGALPTETFVLRWTGLNADAQATSPLLRMECAIRYETAGSEAAGGTDRGRSLAAMDAELLAALLEEPQRMVKMDASVSPPAPVGGNVFWSAPVVGATETLAGRTGRSTTVLVYSVDEAGER